MQKTVCLVTLALFSSETSALKIKSDPICSSAGCSQYKHPHEKEDHKVDYFVPNFGAKDSVLTHNDESLAYAEAKLNHHWNWSKSKDDVKKDYFVPNFGMDVDIADSLKNMKAAVATHGTWDLPKDDWFLQTEAHSDPICASSGCWHSDWFKENKEKIAQYPDPEADGLSEDVKTTLAHEKAAS